MSLEDTLSNLTIYDAKKYFRKAQNVMFNYTDMEAKVREATNNEPWGASSTLMKQIAQGTYNIREREEILGMVFRRYTEKTASEWRQIYKSLQLTDYLIKHGSERFIDDVRTSISLIKMLESFHYIDSQGRDQGINVRNKAQSLVAFLKDDDLIRAERKKARETSKKFNNVAGGSAAAETLGQNPRAGFRSSYNNGISVSADFDSEDEDNSHAAPKITSASNLPANNDDLFTFNKSSNESINIRNSASQDIAADGDDDDDDDFADFQSAAPVAAQSNVQDSLQNSLFDVGTGISAPSTTYTQMNFPEVVPAIASEQKKVDPFGSLFMNAKTEPIQAKKSSPPSTNIASPVQAQEDDDNDLFGEMTEAAPIVQPAKLTQPAQPAQPAQPTSNNDVVDLLDL
ncbi:hypothetical protein TPHA_0B00400 [Tetrapisispora phaffii CBS 4417]|uniref:ENTH domain-containing protein n=1 Tax=Tetrapisispora phaffii (strain ATCC 24235 / CBS 4417 / NBRC 1672 / NRRL Y-8282 / UCD 70-5) TaxID=1071381 RepID=G8BQB4_TETPH|nr:hypothetical protein TPHA_0B00400 [Tetrapisispora phaffii CBS 4417]CCE61711.1 hypothetical protein TPHA_0B00400 [Tetrapisispora phaffii CBS 4417]